MKTIAIDDEPLALQNLSGYIQKTPFLEFIGAFDNPFNALEYLTTNQVDLILIDVEMPDLLGTELIKALKTPVKIIFTTAYEKYALEGYKLDAVDYLLKPFSYDEFLVAVQKAFRIVQLEKNQGGGVPVSDSSGEFLFLKSDYKIKKIVLNDILYIEGLKDYIKVYLVDNPKPILSISSMKMIESKLPSDRFMRVHKSYIVNLQRVTMVERLRIVFGKEYIPVSNQYKDLFLKFLENNSL